MFTMKSGRTPGPGNWVLNDFRYPAKMTTLELTNYQHT